MEQPDLFGEKDEARSSIERDFHALARTTDTATSHLAAEAIVADLPALRASVLRMVRENPGRTTNELAELAQVRDNRQIGRRLPELEEEGLVTRGAWRECSITGRMASTWNP